ncbi:MAG: response regulator [Acidobacteriota bacterium]|nr:response regulator [Acidobacteriota bacterium]
MPVILTIDDERAIRQSFRHFLEDCDYDVLEAADGGEGLEIFRFEQPDLVLVDLRMPKIDGLDVLASVRETSPDTPIVVISGTGVIGDAVEALRLGAWDFLLKPVKDLSILLHTVERCLERARLIRENRAYQQELESKVALRTRELAEANRHAIRTARALRAGEAQIREINRGLEERVAERTRQLEAAQAELVENAQRVGMANIAAGTLHNIGNILNSVNVSIEELQNAVRGSKIRGLLKANEMIRNHIGDLGSFFSVHPRGRLIPEYFKELGDILTADQRMLEDELRYLGTKVAMMRDVMETQKRYADLTQTRQGAPVVDLVEDALRLQGPALQRHDVDILRDYRDHPVCLTSKVKLMFVLNHLISNGIEAMEGMGRASKQLTIQVLTTRDDRAEIRVCDTGHGIPADKLDRIFSHGFTTKPKRQGFGLHTSANLMTEMGGSLQVFSKGPDQGAEFVLALPMAGESDKSTVYLET